MNPYRSLMGLLLACLLAAAPAAAAELPKYVVDQRVALLSKQVAERMTGVTPQAAAQKLNALRSDSAKFIAQYATYMTIVDAYDKEKGNTKAADERDYLLAQQVAAIPPGGVVKTLAVELGTLRKTSSVAYSAKVAAHEKALSDYEQQKTIDAYLAKLAKEVASRTAGGDATKIAKELKDLYKTNPVQAMAKVNEYKTFIAQHDQLAGTAGAGASKIDPDVAEWVKKLMVAFPKKGWDPIALGNVLQNVKTKDPAKYAELAGSGVNAMGEFLSIPGVGAAYMGAGTGWAAYQKSLQKPKSEDGVPVEKKKDDPLDPAPEDRDIPTVLIALLEKDPASVGAAMAARFGEYLTAGDEGKYVGAEARKDEAVMTALKASPLGWVDALLAKKEYSKLAFLYLVLGTGSSDVSWAEGDKALKNSLPKEGKHYQDLVREMKPWTGEASTGKTVKGPINKAAPETAFAFLEDAAQNAELILQKSPLDRDMVVGNIGDNEQKEGVFGGDPKAAGITGPIKGFGMKQLYLEGSAGNENVHQINDPYGVGRHIIVKMMTVYEGGKAYNKIGIYDVTNSGDIFGRKFDIASGGSLTFKLDDRTPGMPDYKLSFKTKGDKTEVVFGRAGKSEPAHQIKTSVSELYEKRAKQAALDGDHLTIDGQDFLVLGQGGGKGGLLFFPADLQKRIDAGEKGLTPSHISLGLNERLPDGRTLPNSGKPALIGVKIKDLEHHLEFDKTAQAWTVVGGPGDPPTPVTPTTTTTGTGTTDPGGQTQTQTQNKVGETMTTQVVQQLLAGGYEVNKEVQSGLTPSVAETFMVLSVKPGVLMKWAKRHYMTAPGSDIVGLPIAKADDPMDKNERQNGEVLGLGKYLKVRSPRGDVSYFDLTDADKARDTIYKKAGSILDGDVNELTDALLFDPAHDYDAFRAAGFTAAEAKTAFEQLRTAMVQFGNPAAYQISGKKETKLGIRVLGKTMFFWPKVEEAGVTPKDDKTSGKGTAYDDSIQGGPVEEGFPVAEIEPNTSSGPAKGFLMTPKTKTDAALYADDKDPKKAGRWWLVFTYVNDDGATKQSRQIMVFDNSGAEELATFPGFESLKFSGTKKKPAADVAHFGAVWLIKGSDTNKAKGVYGAFSNKDAKTVRDKADICLGPVVWWGVTDEQAKTACEKNEL